MITQHRGLVVAFLFLLLRVVMSACGIVFRSTVEKRTGALVLLPLSVFAAWAVWCSL